MFHRVLLNTPGIVWDIPQFQVYLCDEKGYLDVWSSFYERIVESFVMSTWSSAVRVGRGDGVGKDGMWCCLHVTSCSTVQELMSVCVCVCVCVTSRPKGEFACTAFSELHHATQISRFVSDIASTRWQCLYMGGKSRCIGMELGVKWCCFALV
jgi:hypothetical protein